MMEKSEISYLEYYNESRNCERYEKWGRRQYDMKQYT